jgi:Holliday junction resolvase RusA-like endonuclease
MIEFEVFGVPIPKGSMRAFIRPGARFPIVTAANRKTKPWAQEITLTAMQFQQRPLWDGPVALVAIFQMPRPKSLSRKKFTYHIRKPDLDKLLRTLKDALKGVIYEDDAQVVLSTTTKLYAAIPSVIIALKQIHQSDEASFNERHIS